MSEVISVKTVKLLDARKMAQRGEIFGPAVGDFVEGYETAFLRLYDEAITRLKSKPRVFGTAI